MSINKVYLADCMEVMKRMKDKSVDLCIVDPPYGIGVSSKNFMRKGKQTGKSLAVSGIRYDIKEWDSKIPNQIYFDELMRISKNQIIWGGNYFANLLNNTSCWLVWDKKTGNNYYADCELAWTSFDSAVRKFEWMWKGMFQSNMANKEERIHPTQKPVALYKWLLQNYAKKGDKIFDSHVGSGSSRIACYDLGFDFEGCEIDKDYWEAQEERFNTYIQQQSLFTPEELEPQIYEQDELF